MEDYREIANKAVENKKDLMPVHNGTVSQYKTRLIIFRDVLEEADIVLKDLGNKYIKENNCNLEQIEQIREINKEIITSFIEYFNANK
ncbi:hypothetical protein [Flavobacterium sp. LHD-85]|uniref:hypothetical protein n=1 Tax=Flavobacterium sp. LHD-85 TaxID=3071410 RepID=UPI0027DEFC80|nr:hypothetical protein [Flavobacterium sp. LHD-85]MDQ6528408.1 hypothetical protein [Flavobacterium sp. LHD-85]